MSLKGFQQALAELVMSPQFRKLVAAEPLEALAPFDLSERDRRRLATLAHDDRLKMGTIIHRSFRLATLSNTLPRTCRALGAAGVKELVTAYWRDHLPRNYFYTQEASRFAAFALAKLRDEGLRYLYLPEVLLAELAMLELAEGEPWLPGPAAAGDLAPRPGPLRLDPCCRVVRFRHDPDLLLPALKAGPIPELPEGEHYLVLAGAGTAGVTLRQVAVSWGRALIEVAEAENEEARDALSPELAGALLAAGYLRSAPAIAPENALERRNPL